MKEGKTLTKEDKKIKVGYYWLVYRAISFAHMIAPYIKHWNEDALSKVPTYHYYHEYNPKDNNLNSTHFNYNNSYYNHY